VSVEVGIRADPDGSGRLAGDTGFLDPSHGGLRPNAEVRFGLRSRHAVVEPWSNGQTEGQINRLKTLKRGMYGRAGIDLLRARMMPLQG
jgi:hypothetical protein